MTVPKRFIAEANNEENRKLLLLLAIGETVSV